MKWSMRIFGDVSNDSMIGAPVRFDMYTRISLLLYSNKPNLPPKKFCTLLVNNEKMILYYDFVVSPLLKIQYLNLNHFNSAYQNWWYSILCTYISWAIIFSQDFLILFSNIILAILSWKFCAGKLFQGVSGAPV